MKRLAPALAGAAALLALTGSPSALAAQPVTEPTGPVCGSPGAPGYLSLQACVRVSGNQVYLSGLATPTSPATWQTQQIGFTLSGIGIGAPNVSNLSTTVLVTANETSVGTLTATVPCGTHVTAAFSVNQPGWAPSTSTVSITVAC
ncbi:hypothetical protein [Kitasatospora sp. NPDC054795]